VVNLWTESLKGPEVTGEEAEEEEGGGGGRRSSALGTVELRDDADEWMMMRRFNPPACVKRSITPRSAGVHC
jgi:hypothetical protein